MTLYAALKCVFSAAKFRVLMLLVWNRWHQWLRICTCPTNQLGDMIRVGIELGLMAGTNGHDGIETCAPYTEFVGPAGSGLCLFGCMHVDVIPVFVITVCAWQNQLKACLCLHARYRSR